MSQKIVIDPVTRVEGHGRVTIHLDDYGKVKDSFFHIVEFRGFGQINCEDCCTMPRFFSPMLCIFSIWLHLIYYLALMHPKKKEM